MNPLNDDTLSAIWTSEGSAGVDKEKVMNVVNTVLDEDRTAREQERRIRLVLLVVLALFCPVLVWCAAFGVAPLVRGGYALMAAGAAMVVCAEWTYLEWLRRALPGPADARSQLQRTAFLVARQATLLRTAGLWSAPVFIGTAMIGLWLYQQRSHAGGYLLWMALGAAWLLGAAGGLSKGAALDRRRSRMEQLLNDL